VAQLHAIEHAHCAQPLDVLVELGLSGGRTGCRTHDQALALARAAHASPAVRLVGLECYEGLWAQGDSEADTAMVQALMQRVHTLAHQCEAEGLFNDTPEVIITAGGSAVFDLVAPLLKPALQRPVRSLLRSGCYLTHDHGGYQRFVNPLNQRLAHTGLNGQPWTGGHGLQAALEVWAVVQSCPEPGLAILNAGKRDLSHDLGLPTPVRWAPQGQMQPLPSPDAWHITALNDQHAYLQTGSGAHPEHPTLRVGDRVALGISHPCTTFDKWRWMPLIDDTGCMVDAIHTQF
jgi:D-serine dehydratase